MSISRRYKKIGFSDFSGGEGEKYLVENAKFFQSEKVQIDLKSKSIKLATSWENRTIAGFQTEWYNQVPCQYNNYNYHLTVLEATGVVKLYKATGAGAFALEYDFAAKNGLDEVHGLIEYKDKLIAMFWDDTAGENVQYYSTATATTWTQISTLPNNQLFKKHLVVDNTLYVFFENSIYTSTDGITFSLYLTMPTNVFLISAEFFKNFIYISTHEYKTSNNTLFVIENGALIRIRNIRELSQIMATDNFLYLFSTALTGTRIYRFDGDTIKKFYDFDGYATMPANVNPHLYKDKKLYFTADWQAVTDVYSLYSIVNDEAIYKEATFTGDEFIRSMYVISNTIYIVATLDNAVTKSTKIYNNSSAIFELSGYLETSIINKGENVPIQIIVRHKPLPADTSVKIYQKFDHASSYTLILTSDTDNAVKKKYNFPKGTLCDFIQFKIELLTTDDTKTPEDIDLTFIYKPLGLEVAN